MNWGMITWQIPLARYPTTYNKRPLAYVALAAQKNNYALYLSGVYAEGEQTQAARRGRRAGQEAGHGQELRAFQEHRGSAAGRHRRTHRQHVGSRPTSRATKPGAAPRVEPRSCMRRSMAAAEYVFRFHAGRSTRPGPASSLAPRPIRGHNSPMPPPPGAGATTKART